jgi:phage-related protein
MAGDIGSATVRVSPNMTGIQGKIAAGFKGAAGPATAALGDEVEKNSGPFQGALGKLGGFAKAGGLAIAAGLAAGAAGMAALTGKALQAGAELEQQLGGAEAVFGEYANQIKAAADDAYTNAGLSQNEFLQGANKMGSLFQGAGFDVQSSMKMSAESMQRASDVASIMGIDTTTALEAVTGMAKGNFTMMDNLGVAMNDTAIGAYALSKGINKSTSEMSIQEKVGLAQQMFMEKTAKYAGNYAKENDTLAGSINTTKKAFEDFMATGNVNGFVNSLVKTIEIAVPTIVNLLPKLVEGIGKILEAVVPALSAALPTLIPALINAAKILILALVNAMPTIVQALLGALPTLIQAFIQLFLAIVQALPQIITIIANALPEVIKALVEGLTNPTALTAMIMGFIQLFLALVTALPQIIVALVDALPIIIDNIVKTLTSTEFINMMIKATITLFMAIIKAIPQIIGSLVGALGSILKTIGDTLSPGNLARIGGDMIKGLWNGINDLGKWVLDKIKGFGDSILNGIKGFFGIHSPSTVFAEIGHNLDRGLAQGIEGSAGLVSDAVDSMANSALASMTANPSLDASMNVNPMNSTPDYARASLAATPPIVQNNDVYNQVDMDKVTTDLAWQVRRK